MRANPVHLLVGPDGVARVELERDFQLLAQAESGAPAAAHVWTCSDCAVVLGVSLDADRECDLNACAQEGVSVLRRGSGGGAVVIGVGTLQYAIILPYALSEELASIPDSKRFCNRLTMRALASAGADLGLSDDTSGDIRLNDRKVAGVALRRGRRAMLLHGTVLVGADLDRIQRLLRHPAREPDYRGGRSHRDFLANLPAIDAAVFGAALAQQIGALRPS